MNDFLFNLLLFALNVFLMFMNYFNGNFGLALFNAFTAGALLVASAYSVKEIRA